MGQGASKSSKKLARADVLQLFAARCSRLLQPIEVVSLSNNFKQYAFTTDATQYWNQDTLTNFLDIPESAKVSNLLYKSVLFLASFPFIQNYSTAAVTYESLIKAIAFYTKRLNGILKSDYDFVKLYFLSFAAPQTNSANDLRVEPEKFKSEKNDLVPFSLKDTDSWDTLSFVQNFDQIDLASSYISALELYRLVSFLLCIFELRSGEFISASSIDKNFKPSQYQLFQKSALCILRSIESGLPERNAFSTQKDWEDAMTQTKIGYLQFEKAYRTSFPHLFEPLKTLFAGLLYPKNLDYKANNLDQLGLQPKLESVQNDVCAAKPNHKIFKKEAPTKLVNSATVAQLGTMFGQEVYDEMKKLYIGTQAGFSLQSFEHKVFNWKESTLLLVLGRPVGELESSARERQFNETIPPLNALKEKDQNQQPITKLCNETTVKTSNNTHSQANFVFGAVVTDRWKAHTKNTFGNEQSVIIQLEPVQDRFLAKPKDQTPADSDKYYAYFTKMVPGGIGFGSAPPIYPQGFPSLAGGEFSSSFGIPKSSPYMARRRSSSFAITPQFSLGKVSLTLDDSLEFGVFRHLGHGGSYEPSTGSRENDEWENRFEILELEVWGNGKHHTLEKRATI